MLAVSALVIGAGTGKPRQLPLGRDMHLDGIEAGPLNGEGVIAVVVVLGLAYPFIFNVHLSSAENFIGKISAVILYIHTYAPVRYVNNYNKSEKFCQ